VDVNLLLSALQQTLDFEQSLERRFSIAESRTSLDTTVSADGGQGVLGSHLISAVFEPYLGLWVDAQEKELANLLPQYRARPVRPPEEDFSSQMVVHSASELFNFYRLSLQQCAKLSTGQSLLDLSKVFARFLNLYAEQVLLSCLQEKPTGGTPSRIPSLEDIITVLNTADYCYNTTQSLSDKIQSRIDEPLKESVDLSSQADAFMGIASASVRALVRIVEVALEPSWREMRNIGWARIETAADKSSFMAPLQQAIRSKSASILDMIHKPQYSRAFADNLVELLSSTYLAQIVLCRPISEGGAEQMLLDLHEFRSTLSSILPGDPPPASFLKRVTNSFGRIEPLLKTLQVRPQPPEALVQAYLIHIADLSEANFRKILDIKGLRRQEQTQLIELYQMHKFSPRYKDSLTEKSTLLTPLILANTNATAASATTAGANVALQNLSALGNSAAQSLSTANLPANMKFDASGLGNAIMDRFSTPSIGTPMAAQSPPGGTAGMGNPMDGVDGQGKLNENLKNIGKFFKRDLGGLGLGGRFGQGSKATSPAPPEDRHQ
jgi:vacuolar protein sorting-associated protein 53